MSPPFCSGIYKSQKGRKYYHINFMPTLGAINQHMGMLLDSLKHQLTRSPNRSVDPAPILHLIVTELNSLSLSEMFSNTLMFSEGFSACLGLLMELMFSPRKQFRNSSI